MQTMAAWSDGTRLAASKFQWQFCVMEIKIQ